MARVIFRNFAVRVRGGGIGWGWSGWNGVCGVGWVGWDGVGSNEVKMNSGCDAKLKNRINTVWHGMNAGTRCWHDGNSCNKQIRHTTFFPRCADFNYVEATPRSAESSRVLTTSHAWGARNAHAAACNLHRPSPSQSLDPEPSMSLVAARCCSISPKIRTAPPKHIPPPRTPQRRHPGSRHGNSGIFKGIDTP